MNVHRRINPRFAFPLALLLLAVPVLSVGGFNADADSGVTQVPCSDPLGCPDLWADAATMAPQIQTKTFKSNHCDVVEGVTSAGTRKLMRFTFTTPNNGPGDLIVGFPEDHPEWFEWGACHGHWHFRLYAAYRLWTPANFQKWDQLRTANPHKSGDQILAENPTLKFVTGKKQGFCVMDILPYGIGAPKYPTCAYQGISVGWADEYYDGLDGQYIDVTSVPAGTYILEEEVNAARLYTETDYNNNRAWVQVTI